MPPAAQALTREKALIFRITHRDNLPWILTNGMHCANSPHKDPNFVSIGNADLIGKRHFRGIPCPPGGTLSDYIPFYFTPFTPMMLNIKTGRGGIKKRTNDEILIFVSSLPKLQKLGVPFLFTDRHAYLVAAQFFNSTTMLDQIDWTLLQRRDFKKDPDNPEKVERYQAEALVYGALPVSALLGIICGDEAVRGRVAQICSSSGHSCDVRCLPQWYV